MAYRLGTALLTLVIFVATGALADIAIAHTDAELEKIFSARPRPPLSNMYEAVDALTPDERNRLALLAAQHLSLGELGKNITAADWKPEFLGRPDKADLRKRWGENMHAVDALRYASDKRYITDARVIPYLIDALSHPDMSFVRSGAFYSLAALTRHRSGVSSISYPTDESREDISNWWRSWWASNKDRHPIFDRELEAQALEEWLRVARIVKSLAREFRVLTAFRMPAEYQKNIADTSPLFQTDYAPGLLATIWWGKGPKPDDNLWLDILVSLRTEDIVEPRSGWNREKPIVAFGKLPVRTIYEKTIPNTDVVIQLRVATTDESLISALVSGLTGFQPFPGSKECWDWKSSPKVSAN